jgi:hypothetical protein
MKWGASAQAGPARKKLAPRIPKHDEKLKQLGEHEPYSVVAKTLEILVPQVKTHITELQ